MRRLTGTGLPRQPVLEINPQHPLLRRLNREPADPNLAEWAHVLYDQAVLTLGARIEEPAAFVAKLNDLLVTLTQEPNAPPEPPEGAAEPPEAAAEPPQAAAEPPEGPAEPPQDAAEPPPPGEDG
jgi:molecular chaperone HtpG